MTRRKPNSKLRARNSELVSKLLVWFSTNARDLPWRRTHDPYAIWVSEIMLQQTQVKTVISYWERWMSELPTVRAVAKASPTKLHKLWEGLGYYTRVRNLQKAAQKIVAPHGGKFPKEFEEILALPGIGRYTAGAICSIAFNQPRPILDGNVTRVLTRIFGIASDPRERKTNARLWHLATELVVHASRTTHHVRPSSEFNQSLMELGALVCTPRSPKCGDCPVNKLCVARKRNLQEKLPNLGQRVKTTNRRFVAFVVERNGKFLVRQRPAGVVNAHLWEFPHVEILGAPASLPASFFSQPANAPAGMPAPPACGFRLCSAKPFCVIKHSITRYRIALEAYHAQLASPRSTPDGRWLSIPQLHKLAFASAHKKILARIGAPSAASARTAKPR